MRFCAAKSADRHPVRFVCVAYNYLTAVTTGPPRADPHIRHLLPQPPRTEGSDRLRASRWKRPPEGAVGRCPALPGKNQDSQMNLSRLVLSHGNFVHFFG